MRQLNVILSRSPLRISLGGGGTDLPSYYREREGFLISAAINKYVYVAINRPFQNEIILKYSSIERVERIEEIAHPIIRECLIAMRLNGEGIEISTIADLPSGTGLGSSGSFTTALLKGLSAYCRTPIQNDELARLACEIEIERLNEPIGKQDQYISAFGGLTAFKFKRDGSVEVEPLRLESTIMQHLSDNLLLFFTGQSRSASAILHDQNAKSILNDQAMMQNLDLIKDIGERSYIALKSGNIDELGSLMNEHWEHKRIRSQGISNSSINDAYTHALKNGAVGGKVVGAGGGGFLMFYARDPEKLRKTMEDLGMPEVRFDFDFQGTTLVIS